MMLTLRLRIVYGSQNKQRGAVLTARYVMSP